MHPGMFGGRNPHPPLKPHCSHARTKGGPEPTTEASLLVCSQWAWPCEFWTSARVPAGCPRAEARLESKPAPAAMQLQTQGCTECATAVRSVDSSAAGIFLDSAPSGVRADNWCGCRLVCECALRGGASVWADSPLPRRARCATTAVLAPDLCLRACTGSFVRTVPEGHLGQLPESPRLRPGRGQC